MQKSQQNITKTEFKSTLKGAYTMIKWDWFQAHKDGSTSANPSMWYKIDNDTR